ncbi:MAG TPA: SAF domain-containing protein [Acidimicrobiia bacterium]|nr:SAF domain-containing protein [Acidimicrobiia bacterium]
MKSTHKTLIAGVALLAITSACGSDSKTATKRVPTASTGASSGTGTASGTMATASTSATGAANTTSPAPSGTKAKIVTAYVASGLIPKGTTGKEAVDKNLLDPQRITAGALPPHALTNVDSISDKVAVSDIGAGKFVLETDFASK